MPTIAKIDDFLSKDECWKRVVDRDVSLLIYLTEEFQGGEILFNNFQYRLKPRAGMVVYFPSDHRYVHTALPVTGMISADSAARPIRPKY